MSDEAGEGHGEGSHGGFLVERLRTSKLRAVGMRFNRAEVFAAFQASGQSRGGRWRNCVAPGERVDRAVRVLDEIEELESDLENDGLAPRRATAFSPPGRYLRA